MGIYEQRQGVYLLKFLSIIVSLGPILSLRKRGGEKVPFLVASRPAWCVGGFRNPLVSRDDNASREDNGRRCLEVGQWLRRLATRVDCKRQS